MKEHTNIHWTSVSLSELTQLQRADILANGYWQRNQLSFTVDPYNFEKWVVIPAYRLGFPKCVPSVTEDMWFSQKTWAALWVDQSDQQ